jgi:hypothetical protein
MTSTSRFASKTAAPRAPGYLRVVTPPPALLVAAKARVVAAAYPPAALALD